MTSINLDNWHSENPAYIVGSAFKNPVTGIIHHRSHGILCKSWKDTISLVKELMIDKIKTMTGYQEAPEYIRIYKVSVVDITKDCDILVPLLVKKSLIKEH
jgi:hypothetical protein